MLNEAGELAGAHCACGREVAEPAGAPCVEDPHLHSSQGLREEHSSLRNRAVAVETPVWCAWCLLSVRALKATGGQLRTSRLVHGAGDGG